VRIELRINGKPYNYEFFNEKTNLLSFLLDTLRLTGTKNGCAEGHCGACTVIVNGKAVLACRTLLNGLDGAEVTTIEGLSDSETVHPLIYAFVKAGAVQCGFCTPGFIMSAKALLDGYFAAGRAARTDTPSCLTDEEIRKALIRNVCRCTGYVKIADAVRLAADLLSRGRTRIPGGDPPGP
jgi:carbon-monoxide dehydrogenase small subunit